MSLYSPGDQWLSPPHEVDGYSQWMGCSNGSPYVLSEVPGTSDDNHKPLLRRVWL